MHLLDLTLPTPEENLALDEWLLTTPLSTLGTAGVLRLWELPEPCVILGRGSRVDQEVDRAACDMAGIPILRRISGGATVVAGPGCLMYSLSLPNHHFGGSLDQPVHNIPAIHDYVMPKMSAALQSLGCPVAVAGTSDLVLNHPADLGSQNTQAKKISGNSVRVGKDRVLYHGTILYQFDLALVDRLLRHPPREPAYRKNRPHSQFLANLGRPARNLKASLIPAWAAVEATAPIKSAATRCGGRSRYCDSTWNLRF